MVFDCNLCQLVSQPTHIAGNTLDLVLTTEPAAVEALRVHPASDCPMSSAPRPTPLRMYDYAKANSEGLSEFLLEADYNRCLLSTNVKGIWECLRNITHDGMNKYIPKMTLKFNRQP